MIIFCITCKGRTGHLARTLPQNLRDNKRAKFVLVNYNSQDHLDDYILSNHQDDLDRLVVYRFTEPGPFRMAHAKNLAHRLAIREGADVLVNLDADNFTGPNFDQWLIANVNDQQFAYTHMKKGILPRGVSGRIAVTKHQFYLTGGYDEIYRTWAPDDKDFNTRLQRLGFKGVEIPDEYLKAIKHSDKLRFREYPEAESNSYFDLAGRDDVTISNWGKIGLGTVYRNYNPEPIEVNPIPTRIFGIGWHKTATTSLSQALNVLGHKCDHWKNAHWAKMIWAEMSCYGKSLTLEQSYAASDVPICLFYKDLDQQYPGSKFILTVRDEDEWLKSVEGHFNRDVNPFRNSWDTDPFSHKVHRQMYGCKNFNHDIFLERYRRHNAEVIDYFGDRLLIMDMTKNAGWFELCGFLKQRIPEVNYPRLNKY